MPTVLTANRLTHEQLRAVLTPTPGGRKDEFVCPLCEHGHLTLFGDDGFDCKNDCDDKALAKRLHELVGGKQRHVPRVMPKPSMRSGTNLADDPNWQGFTVREYCEMKKLSLPWLVMNYTPDLRSPNPMQAEKSGKQVVAFAYMDADRKVLFTRHRFSADTKPRSEFGSVMSIPYGLWLHTNKPDKKGQWPRAVILCEGESSQQTLTMHGFPAIGVPGASNWKSEWASLPVLKYAEKLFVIQEPKEDGKPDAGKKLVDDITRDFPSGKAVAVKLPVKDASDLHLANLIGKELGSDITFGDELVEAIRSAVPKTDDWRQYFHTVSELDEGELKLLVKGFLPEGVTFLGSLSGVGKTWLGLSLAKALTTGRPFLGVYDVPEQQNVLYLVPEMGARALRRRAEKMGIPFNDDRFRCQTLKDGVLNLESPQLYAAVKEMKYVVFLDTAIRFTSGVEENSSSANASGLATAVFSLLRHGAPAVICNHHSPKGAVESDFMTLENVLRGTGDFGAMCDCVWGVQHAKKKKDEDYRQESSDLTRLFLKCVKPRDFEPVDPFVIQGRPYIDEVGDFRVIASGELEMPDEQSQDDKVALLLRLIDENPKVGIKELMRKTGLHNVTLKKKAEESGRVWSPTEGWKRADESENF